MLGRDDELFVMRSFAKRCSQCAPPHEAFVDHHTLCEEGIVKAKDVYQYLYNRNGNACSVVDSEGNQHMRVEIPQGYDVVRDLLKAIEYSMQFQSRLKHAPVISYDENYYVAPRPVREISPESQYVKPSRREKSYIPDRGSLYHSEMAEHKTQREDITYETKPRGARGSKAHYR